MLQRRFYTSPKIMLIPSLPYITTAAVNENAAEYVDATCTIQINTMRVCSRDLLPFSSLLLLFLS